MLVTRHVNFTTIKKYQPGVNVRTINYYIGGDTTYRRDGQWLKSDVPTH